MSLFINTFKRLHYPTDVISQYIRFHLAYTLSLRNLEEMMDEKGIVVNHSTAAKTIDFLLTDKRGTAAALHFFRKTISRHSEAEAVSINKNGANTSAFGHVQCR